jgi:hypothetical protein
MCNEKTKALCHELVVRLGRVEVGLGIERERIRGRTTKRISG